MLRSSGSFVVVVAFCTMLTGLVSARAAEVLPRAEVDRIVQPLVEGQWVQGAVVGLVRVSPDDAQQVQTQMIGYGRMSAEDPRVPDENTVFEIGSVTKGFTGLLLADAVVRGEMKLDDPVQKYLPDNVQLKQIGARPVSLLHLAAHRSGYPSLPTNFAPADENNPYADYTVDDLYSFLRTSEPDRGAGRKYEYCNVGAGLLGHVLARHAGKDYEQLLKDRITTKLGMDATSIVLNDNQRSRLAPGHDGDGNPTANWDLPTLAGAGALRSNVRDMLKFVSANITFFNADLAEAMKLAHKKHADVADDITIGLGWHRSEKLGAVQHNGQTGGYHSYVAFVPEKKVGVVVLTNTATMQVDPVGEALLEKLLGRDANPPDLRQTVKLDDAALARCVGTYRASPLFSFVITKEGSQLHCQCTGQPNFRIYPESETKFFWKVVDAQVTFDVDDEGKVTGLTLHQNGQNVPAKKSE